MFIPDNIFSIIFFTVPGGVFLLYSKYLRSTPFIERDESLKISSALIFAFVNFPLTFAFSKIVELWQNKDTFIWYALVVSANLILSLCLCYSWTLIESTVLLKIDNLFRKNDNKALVVDSKSAWDYIFEDNKLKIDITIPRVVKIEQNGISSVGLLSMFNSSPANKTEYILDYSSNIKAYFDFDEKESDPTKKYFNDVLYEYINITENYKITFYDCTKYYKQNPKQVTS